MLVMRTTEDPTGPVGQLVSAQQPLGLYHLPLAVHPLRLYGVQPQALLGQKAAYDPHSSFAATLIDLAVVLADPAPHLPAYVPTGVVPDQHQHALAKSFELLAAPRKIARGYGAHRSSVHKPKPSLFELGHIQSRSEEHTSE